MSQTPQNAKTKQPTLSSNMSLKRHHYRHHYRILVTQRSALGATNVRYFGIYAVSPPEGGWEGVARCLIPELNEAISYTVTSEEIPREITIETMCDALTTLNV